MRGDRLAQRQLYERFKGKLFSLCLRYADSREDAEDMLQEGFVQIFKDLHQFQMLGSLEGWMRKVVLRVVLQNLRRQKRQVLTQELNSWNEHFSHEETDEATVPENMIHLVLHFMQKMPVGFRTVLNLYIMEGYTHEQIAETLGITAGTSKSQLSRAKVYLKNLLDKTLAS